MGSTGEGKCPGWHCACVAEFICVLDVRRRGQKAATARGSKPSGFPTVAFFAGDPHPSVSAKMSLSTLGAGLRGDGSRTWPSGSSTCWPCTLRRPGCKNGSLVMNVSRRVPVVVSKRQAWGSCRQPADVASEMLRIHHNACWTTHQRHGRFTKTRQWFGWPAFGGLFLPCLWIGSWAGSRETCEDVGVGRG